MRAGIQKPVGRIDDAHAFDLGGWLIGSCNEQHGVGIADLEQRRAFALQRLGIADVVGYLNVALLALL